MHAAFEYERHSHFRSAATRYCTVSVARVAPGHRGALRVLPGKRAPWLAVTGAVAVRRGSDCQSPSVLDVVRV